MRQAILLSILLLGLLSNPASAEVLGPDQLPESLQGIWKVSLCVMKGHAWIRYEEVDTGIVHTVGRYAKGAGQQIDKETKEIIQPKAPVSGVYWDKELRYEQDVQAGKYRLLSVIVKNPRILRGQGDGYGHGRVRNNCVTYARDVWAYYTNEFYNLPVFAAPEDLLAEIVRRHPEVLK